MGLLDALSGGLTAATQAAGAQQQGEMQGSQMLRAIMMQQLDAENKRASTFMNEERGRSFQRTANQPAPSTVHTGEDGTMYRVTADGTATPITINGGPPPAAVADTSGTTGPSAPSVPGVPSAPNVLKARTPPVQQGHVVDPVTGKVTFFDPTKPPTDLRVHPKPTEQPLVQVQQPGGGVVYMPRNQAAGMQAPGKAGTGALAAPMAAKVGQFGEMLKKASDLLPAMSALDVSLQNSAGQDIAAHGVGVGSLRLPGTQGAGSMMVNRDPAYASYQAALTPFILAAAHALSGARINQDQVEQIRASIEIKPGESPQSRAQKHKNLLDLVNSIGGSLPPDAIAEQESQMDQGSLRALTSAGYRGGHGHAAQPAPGKKTYTYGGVTYEVPE